MRGWRASSGSDIVSAMEKKKAIGRISWWFAEVDGEAIPCVHEHWWQAGPPPRYNDTEIPHHQKAHEFVEAIKRLKRVILTKGKAVPKETGEGILIPRAAYVAVFAVEDIEFDEAGLRFTFLKRLVDLV